MVKEDAPPPHYYGDIINLYPIPEQIPNYATSSRSVLYWSYTECNHT